MEAVGVGRRRPSLRLIVESKSCLKQDHGRVPSYGLERNGAVAAGHGFAPLTRVYHEDAVADPPGPSFPLEHIPEKLPGIFD
jgi:hypothetical protein